MTTPTRTAGLKLSYQLAPGADGKSAKKARAYQNVALDAADASLARTAAALAALSGAALLDAQLVATRSIQ